MGLLAALITIPLSILCTQDLTAGLSMILRVAKVHLWPLADSFLLSRQPHCLTRTHSSLSALALADSLRHCVTVRQ